MSTFDHKYKEELTTLGGYKLKKIQSPEDISKVIGVDKTADNGVWNTTNYDKYINNTSYNKVEKNEIYDIISKYSNFLSLIDEYYNNCYITYVNNKEREDEESKPKEPTIGMTSTEVRESTWGKTDKVNKDTYSWGTLNNGYIITKDIFILKMD